LPTYTQIFTEFFRFLTQQREYHEFVSSFSAIDKLRDGLLSSGSSSDSIPEIELVSPGQQGQKNIISPPAY
jgi:hypothetical protein